ncbi:hypothetical protein GCM10010214_39330 [Streptomyces abikoensis]|nr:hypothetical protein GCM10010214_39330 [Streptomyces abikoensis]
MRGGGGTPAATSRVAQPDAAKAGGIGDPGEGATEIPWLYGTASPGDEDVRARRELESIMFGGCLLAQPVPPKRGNADQRQRVRCGSCRKPTTGQRTSV